jgi:RNA polymerase sigma-70 factor, ECF subfamily
MEDRKTKEQKLINEFTETGSEDAFKKLMDMYQDLIMRFGSRMCGHREDAEDVVQDTFLSAFKSMNSFRGEGSFKSWLYKIASSACLKKRRKRKHEPDRELSLDQIHEDRGGEESVSASGGMDTAQTEAEANEMAARLHRAFLELPEKYRITLALRDFEGLSTKEVAGILGITEAATKVRLHRARNVLQKKVECFQKDVAEQDCN